MTDPWIAAFGSHAVIVVALTILMLGVLARMDRALYEIRLEVGQAAPLLEFAAPDGANPCS